MNSLSHPLLFILTRVILGQFEHEYQDARTIAEWGIDWWKHDNCWQKWATVDLYANQLFNSTLPNSTAQVRRDIPAVNSLSNPLLFIP